MELTVPPECYLILYNVSKKHNVGTIARCATAFNVKQICLVGSRKFNTFGSHGAAAHVDFCHYETLEQCCEDLRASKAARILGIEIVDSAVAVQRCPFEGPTAFMLGNEGQGLSERQMRNCDAFTYIPQYGRGTASLNVAVAASIVLQHFATWAGYAEREREGFKFVVADRPPSERRTGVVKRILPAQSDDAGEEMAAVDFSGDGCHLISADIAGPRQGQSGQITASSMTE